MINNNPMTQRDAANVLRADLAKHEPGCDLHTALCVAVNVLEHNIAVRAIKAARKNQRKVSALASISSQSSTTQKENT